ncbi:MAG: cellulase family glycosylhydrolase [Promethearchaeota archaeon]
MKKEDYLDKSVRDRLSKLKWSIKKVNDWYAKQPWFVGCNYIPSDAINQLEMFQRETFNPERIDQELIWAEDLGFNALRVFLHFLLWQDDFPGFKKRLDRFLQICEKHHIKVLMVLFDEMWNQDPKLGIQPDPIPGVHNSGWLASPGRKRVLDESCYPELKGYVQEIINYYTSDERILGWDLYNEPGNMGMRNKSFPLVIASFLWARECNPSQPITVGFWQFNVKSRVWNELELLSIQCSDIISFHDYREVEKTVETIQDLKKYERPILCTEYLARTSNNNFETHLPIFKKEKIGAFNWGFISGKTQTIYSWLSKRGDPEPELWFHDILHEDGTAYSIEEINFIRAALKR